MTTTALPQDGAVSDDQNWREILDAHGELAFSDDPYDSRTTSANFHLDGYLAKFDPVLLATAEGRKILCRHDPLLFALIYLRDHLKNSEGEVSFADAHFLWIRAARRWIGPSRGQREDRRAFVAPRSCGKAVTLDTVIPVPRGWTTMEEIQVGDELFDQDGKICRVVAKSPIWRDSTYRVTFSDGTHVDTHGNHEWTCVDMRSREKYASGRIGRKGPRIGMPTDWRDRWADHSTVTTAHMAENLRLTNGDYRWRVPNARPLELPYANLPIDPYVLGFWLGDGSKGMGVITVNRGDYAEIGERLGPHTVQPGGDRPGSVRVNVTGLVGRLRALGVLNDKHVPMPYLRASIDQRRELVRGLMDSDGYHGSGPFNEEISLNSERLAGHVLELLRTMGLPASMTKGDSKLYGRITGTRYRVRATFDFQPYHLSRYLRESPQKQARITARTVVSVEEVEPRETQCITVDSATHLYLAGEGMVPTHNSTWWFLILPMWSGAYRHVKFAAAFADSGAQAELHLATFKAEQADNILLRTDFDDFCNPARRHTGRTVADNQNMLHTRSGFTFVAKGIDSTSLGMKMGADRPDLLIFDDIEPPESNYSPLQRDKRLSTVENAILPLNELARVAIVGTVTMPGSIIHELVRHSKGEDVEPWVDEQKIRTYHTRAIITRPDGTERSVWSKKWTFEYLNSIRRTRPYMLNYDNDPRGRQGDYWQAEDIRYAPDVASGRPPNITKWFIFVDPPLTQKTRSDECGIALVGYAPGVTTAANRLDRATILANGGPERLREALMVSEVEGGKVTRLSRVHIEMAWGVRLTGKPLRAHLMTILLANPQVKAVILESNAGGSLWNDVFDNLPVKFVTFPSTEAKEVRFARALDFFQTNRVTVSKVIPAFEDQALAWPRVPHDDVLDAVCSGALRLLIPRLAQKDGTVTPR